MQRRENTHIPLALTAFLYAAATAAIATTEAIYLRHELQATYSLMGVILGTSAIGYLLLTPKLNELPKRLGTKNYLTWTSFTLALAAVLAANLTNPALYIASKTALILLVPTTFHALINAVEEQNKYTRNQQTLIFATSLAAATGGMIGFVTGGILANIQLGHAYILATSAFSLAGAISFLLPETNDLRTNHRKTAKLDVLTRLENCFKNKQPLLTWIIITTNAYWAIRDFTIPLLLLDKGYTTTTIGILFAIGAICGVISMLATRYLLEKNHPEQVLVAALLTAAISSLILPFGGLILIGASYAIYVFADTALTPAISDRVEETAPTNLAAPLLTSFAAASAIAWILAPIIAGFLLEAGLYLQAILFLAALANLLIYELARRKWLRKGEWLPTISFKQKKKHLIWN